MLTTSTKWFVAGLKLILKKRSLTQVAVAQKAGVNKSYLSKVLSCKQNISDRSKEKIAAAVNLDSLEITQLGKKHLGRKRINVVREDFEGESEEKFPKNFELERMPIADWDICDRVVKFREHNSLSVRELANIVGIDARRIYSYESKERKIPTDYIIKLYSMLNMSPSWALTGIGCPCLYSSVEAMLDALKGSFEHIELLDLFYLNEFLKHQEDIIYMYDLLQEVCSKLIFRKDLIDQAIPLLKRIHGWLDEIPISDFGDVDSFESVEDLGENADSEMNIPRERFLGFLECRKALLSISSNAIDILKKLI